MSNPWHNCKNFLVIRPDNMGDVIMMTPALRALKQTFSCKITLLTSKMGNAITPFISYIDDTLIYDVPWIKTTNVKRPEACIELVDILKDLHFDAAIISTVYSQSALPSAIIAYMAGIPLRLGWCRENPYDLLTDWIPDKEPYLFVQHQVARELELVAHIGAFCNDERLSLNYNKHVNKDVSTKLKYLGENIDRPFIILHPGVSEAKREYPRHLWIETAKLLHQHTGLPILITGSQDQKQLTDNIEQASGKGVNSVAGLFNIEEFIALIAKAQLVISVNTSTVHIAACVNTPVVVLYALTNPQHTPWKVPAIVLPYSVPENLKSKNEVIRFAQKKYNDEFLDYPSPAEILKNAITLLSEASLEQREKQLKMLP